MFHPGLVSITFRQLTPEAIMDLVVQAGLRSIEWGGDVHLPPGGEAQVTRAEEVRRKMDGHGLATAAYGSYYKAGETAPEVFEGILAVARALGAPTVRVWSGTQGSALADAVQWKAVADDLRRISAMAAGEGITISTEFHANTLTDRAPALLRLFAEVDHPNLKTYWQPSLERPVEVCLEEIAAVAPWLTNLHLYHWLAGHERRPLAEGREPWGRYLEAAAKLPGDRHLLLEFVRGDDPAAFLEDAATLREWMERVG